VTLLAPRLLAARNAYRAHPRRTWVLSALAGLFWVGCLVLFVKVLGYFQTIGEFGPLLTQRLLLLIFVSFFAVLLISNTVTALTTFYLADDVNVLLAAPVSMRRLHRARFVETLVASSWMVLLFGLPAFLAYGVVYDAGPVFYGATVLVLLPYLVVPTALGVLVTTGLVMVFPARRTRDAMLVGVGLLVAAIVGVIRTLQPEQLAHPSGLVGLAGFLAGFEATGSPYLPTTWAAEVLVPLLGGRDGDPLFHFAMLVSTAAMLYVVSATVVERVFLTAWSRAQTGRVRDGGGERPLSRWLERLTRPLPRIPALLFQKDLTVFLRDASQWSQLLLLFALVGIYVYNFSVLPLEDGSPLGRAMRDIATVLNLGLAAFVSTAIAVRFVYPMVSLEGRAWWILRTAPVALSRVWWSKFWIGYVPLVGFAALLIAGTNGYLAVPPLLTAVFLATLVPLMAALVSLGLGFGAAYPRLDTQNAAQIATGFGAIVYMVTSLTLITLVMVLEAWPTWRLLRYYRAPEAFGAGEMAGFAASYAAPFVAMVVAFVVARRVGLRALERLPI
jgi:ABC-2 type transport system permease protein